MPNRIEEIISRIEWINKTLSEYPKVKSGDPLQAIKYSLSCERRRLRIRLSRLNGESHTFKQEMELIKSINGVCAICGKSDNPTIDHIIPISKGGSDGLENLQVLCGSCNSRKGNKID